MSLVRVEIIMNNSKIEGLRKAMGRFGITGMTVMQVLGCGVQYGKQEYEAEPRKEPTLLPKEMVMIVLPLEDLNDFLKFVEEELYTGHIGDGKIFISDISNVIRIRTGEEGYEAIFPQKH